MDPGSVQPWCLPGHLPFYCVSARWCTGAVKTPEKAKRDACPTSQLMGCLAFCLPSRNSGIYDGKHYSWYNGRVYCAGLFSSATLCRIFSVPSAYREGFLKEYSVE